MGKHRHNETQFCDYNGSYGKCPKEPHFGV